MQFSRLDWIPVWEEMRGVNGEVCTGRNGWRKRTDSLNVNHEMYEENSERHSFRFSINTSEFGTMTCYYIIQLYIIELTR
jgi:hypothetical protein